METTTRSPGEVSITNRSGIRPPPSRTSRSLAGLASTAVTTPSEPTVGVLDHGDPTSSWTQSASGSSSGAGEELGAAQRRGLLDAVPTPSKTTMIAVPVGPGVHDRGRSRPSAS